MKPNSVTESKQNEKGFASELGNLPLTCSVLLVLSSLQGEPAYCDNATVFSGGSETSPDELHALL